jgi:hypothetical protein
MMQSCWGHQGKITTNQAAVGQKASGLLGNPVTLAIGAVAAGNLATAMEFTVDIEAAGTGLLLRLLMLWLLMLLMPLWLLLWH